MKQKNILIVSQHFWPETFRVNDIADFLTENNCKVDVLCGIPNYPKGKFYDGYSYFRNRHQRHNGINIRRVFEIPRKNNTNFRIFINYISFPIASLFHLPRLFTKKYDKIFIYQTSPVLMAMAGILVGKIKRVETTMYVLDLWPENLFSVLNIKNIFLKKLLTNISRWHYRKVDKLVVLSDSMKVQLMNITGIKKEKITMLPQSSEKIYENDIYDPILSKRFKNGFNVLYAGNISPAQSFETIIKAAQQLKKGVVKINWIIVGDGMSRQWLEKEVKKNGLSDDFYFEGQKPIEDIPKYNSIANLLIGCLVKSELLEATIPAKVMSYIASGKPIVLAMDGEIQDIINNKIKCGFVGPTEDFKTLAKNITKVQKLSVSERQKMGNRGKAYHLKNFERNILLGKLYNFIFS